ncbi:MAG: response regulator transcription factor [Acidobacteria bacterium]|nr:response regulator transcription factor [Acidobacteriota bacterium]
MTSARASSSRCRSRARHEDPCRRRRSRVAGLDSLRPSPSGLLRLGASDGREAQEIWQRERPDLVILDVNLPRQSGLEVLRAMRTRGDATPVMMLTVRASEEDQVGALDLGADDYLTKPFSPRTLLARVRARLRRAGIEKPAPLEAGGFALDIERLVLSIAGREAVTLTPLECRLVQLLLANAGQPLPVERLTAHVWGWRGAGDKQLLKQLVHRLRQKIEADPAAPRSLVTVPGVGYALDV